jgi:Putative peptidoglycan binding domain
MAAQGQGGTDDHGDDDWFADVEQPGALESDPPSAEDDWLIQPEPVRRARPTPEWGRIAAVGGGLIALLVAGLAAAGVFSGSHAPSTTPITSVSIQAPATTAATSTRSAAALPSRTLKPGDTGAQVRALQRALKALGYPVGKVDGQYGPATKTAVAAFQHTAGLAEDGVVGPKTLNALIQRAGP